MWTRLWCSFIPSVIPLLAHYRPLIAGSGLSGDRNISQFLLVRDFCDIYSVIFRQVNIFSAIPVPNLSSFGALIF